MSYILIFRLSFDAIQVESCSAVILWVYRVKPKLRNEISWCYREQAMSKQGRNIYSESRSEHADKFHDKIVLFFRPRLKLNRSLTLDGVLGCPFDPLPNSPFVA